MEVGEIRGEILSQSIWKRYHSFSKIWFCSVYFLLNFHSLCFLPSPEKRGKMLLCAKLRVHFWLPQLWDILISPQTMVKNKSYLVWWDLVLIMSQKGNWNLNLGHSKRNSRLLIWDHGSTNQRGEKKREAVTERERGSTNQMGSGHGSGKLVGLILNINDAFNSKVCQLILRIFELWNFAE